MSEQLDKFLRERENTPLARQIAEAQIASDALNAPDAIVVKKGARAIGMPEEIVRGDPKAFKRTVDQQTASYDIARSPALANWLARSEANAAIGKTDTSRLADTAQAISTKQEQAQPGFWGRLYGFMRDSNPVLYANDFAVRMGANIPGAYRAGDLDPDKNRASIGAGVAGALSGTAGTFEAVTSLADKYNPGQAALRELGLIGPAEEGFLTTRFREKSEQWKKVADYLRPTTASAEGKAFQSGLESLPVSASALVGGVFGKSAKIAATLTAIPVGGQSFRRGRDEGLSLEGAAAYGAVDAGIEYATERLPFEKLLGGIGSGKGFLTRFVETLPSEIGGEQLATIGQDFNSWVAIDANKGKTFGDFIAERPDAAYQTLIATLVGTGAITSTTSAFEFAANKMGRTVPRVLPAEENARFLNALGNLSAASEVLKRDAPTFAEFIQQASAGTEATDVYVDALQLGTVLDQGNIEPEAAYQMTGLTPDEIAAMADRGEQVRIPVEQFAAYIAPSSVGETLIPHLRIDPHDMSIEEAKVYLQGAKDEFAADAERALADGLQVDEKRASRDRVREVIATEIGSARRFTDDVNQAYAGLVADFYATMGGRLGKSAEDMAALYPLKVQSGEIAQPTYGQGALLNIGLDIPGGGKLDADQVRAALQQYGVLQSDAVLQSDSEPTLVAQLAQALDAQQLSELSAALQQEAIAQFANGQGLLEGPGKANWGDFNPEFFFNLDGSRLSTVLNQSAAALQSQPLEAERGGRVVRNRDLAQAFNLRHQLKYGRALDPSDPADYQIVLDALLDEYADQKAQPDSGEAWYSDDISEALQVTQQVADIAHPIDRDIFLQVAALLSPQQGPIGNWENALLAFDGYYDSGRFALSKPDGQNFGVASHGSGLRLFQHLIDTLGDKEALLWLRTEHTGREMAEMRKASGIFKNHDNLQKYLPSEMNFTESKLGVYMFGPKVGDFALNSAGIDHDAVTVDLWMARTYNRLIGRLLDVPAKDAAAGGIAEQLRGKAERATIKSLVRDAAQQAGITPSAMQAALWYFEQRLYRSHGINAESTSFSEAARAAAAKRGVDVPDRAADARDQQGSAAPAAVDLGDGVRIAENTPDPLRLFRGESLYPTRASRLADGSVVVSGEMLGYPDRLAKIAEQLGVPSVTAVNDNDKRLDQGVPLWFTRPPIEADGMVRLDHFGPAGIERTDPALWGTTNFISPAERARIGTALPRTYFGIASRQPGGYKVEFGPGTAQYETRVDPAKLYDVAADPDGFKQGDGVTALEKRIHAAGYIGYWTNNEELGLVATVFDPLDVKRASAQVYAQDAVFYSALERAIERSAQAKASGQQWAATLKKTPGVKQEELEWTGLLDFLADVEGSVTRDAILELVRGGGVQVDEVVLGATPAIREQEEDRLLEAAENQSQFASWSSDPQNNTYRELLITLPLSEAGNPSRAASTHWDTEGVVAHARFMDKVDADGNRVLFIEEVQSDWHQKGRDQGYETKVDPAVVAAAQAKYDAALREEDAASEVFVPLAQQDWENGLALMADRPNIFREAYPRPNAEWASGAFLSVPDFGANSPAQENPAFAEARQQLQAAFDARKLAGRELDIAKGLITNGGVPNAPFKTTWPALVMKRMIRWAADHGYQKIAWTTGEQQAERYNLSQAVGGEMTVQPMGNGTEVIFGFSEQPRVADRIEESGNGVRMSNSGEVAMTREQAVAVMGADFGGRSFDMGLAGADVVDVQSFSVGGEGMKAFYDRNLVNITNDLIKKYGARVGAVRILAAGEDVGVRVEGDGALLASAQDRDDRAAAIQAAIADLGETESPRHRSLVAALENTLALSDDNISQTRTVAGTPQPGFEITSELADAAMGGFPLFQKTGGPRGQIAFGPDITQTPSVITILRGADLSTFLHETGHFFFEVLNHASGQPGAPPELRADMAAMLKYLGVTSYDEWQNMTPNARREGHERVARSFEAYLFEGRAPSLELRSLFAKMRTWMMNVYRTLTALKVDLTDEVRGVFGRMLASEEAIKDAEADAEMLPYFIDKPEGMSDADWLEYQQLNADAAAEAAHQLEGRSLRDMRYAGRSVAREIKRLQKEVAEKRKAMREEVKPEIEALPVYRMIGWLRTGKLDGEAVEGDHRLHTPTLRELLQLDDGEPLPSSLTGMTSTDNGVNPHQVAELFGYTSTDHMLRDLLFASPLKDAIEAETDNRMRERYGEITSPEAVDEAARAAVHNDVRGRFVATELAALQNAPGKKRVLDGAARRLAEGMIAKLRIRDLRPSQYEAAERRAARAAQKAGATELDEAIRQKRNQLFQFNAAKAAHAAVEEVKKARDYLTKFGNANTRKALDVDYLDQIDQILERFELRPVSNKEADRRKDLTAWIEQQRELGFEPVLDPEMLAEIGRKPWRELTVEEMRGLLDGIKNIEHIARLTKKLLTAKDKADLDQAAGEVAQSITDNAFKDVPEIIGPKTWWERRKSDLSDVFAAHRKFANLTYVFDGNRYGGAAWERFIRAMNAAGDREAVMNRDAGQRLNEMFKQLPKDTTSKLYIPEIENSLSLEGRLVVALNWGNSANRQRMLDGDKWTVEQVEAILDTLTPAHWDFVEQVWSYIDSYWSEIAAKERRVSGVVPEKVEAEPFQIALPGGGLRFIRGGYFPIKYDPDRSSKAEADAAAEVLKQMQRGLYTSATTRRGHTKARATEVKRPVRKDFGVIFEHVSQVIHDLSWHEYLIDANRLLKHKAVDASVRLHYGPATLRWMRKALEDIAIGDIAAQNALERGVNYLRTGASIAGLGWNIWTSLLQPVGLTQSVARIGARHVAKGLAELFSSPAKMNAKIEWIYEVSPFMRTRGDTMQREINEIRNQVSEKGPLRKSLDRVVPSGVNDAIADSYFVLIAKAQLVADLPTWLGQYHKSLDAGEGPDRAVALADQAVIDSQSAGQIKDLAGVQRGGPIWKLWTNFYSYFSATYNLMADRTADLKRRGPSDLPYFAIDFMMLSVVPATITSLMFQLLKGDDDDDWEDRLKKIGLDNLNYMLGLMIGVREVGGAISGMAGYTGPAGARVFGEIGKLGKQVGQGEADEAFVRSANAVAGLLLHYPSGQVDKTVRGAIDVANGDAGPQAVLVGPPVQR